MYEFIRVFISFLIALSVTYLLIPMWIEVCNKWKLFDFPDTRKLHAPCIPTMGGLAIYAGVFMSFFLFADIQHLTVTRYLLCASVLLFFTGFFDDFLDLKASKKLFIQIIAAFIVVAGGTRITSFYGFLGLNEIPEWVQIPLTMLFIIGVTNAYNLIDGIDGLAGGLGTIGALAFGSMFIAYGNIDFAILSFCVAGSLIGFLFYNFHPAKIFMGDTGSLLIGFILSTLAINILTMNEVSTSAFSFITPSFTGAVLFIPLYDIFRVFVIRVLNGDSPLKADRNHLHHTILKHGFTHKGATVILCLYNIVIILLQLLLTNLSLTQFIILSVCLTMLAMNSFTFQRMVWISRKVRGNEVKVLKAG